GPARDVPLPGRGPRAVRGRPHPGLALSGADAHAQRTALADVVEEDRLNAGIPESGDPRMRLGVRDVEHDDDLGGLLLPPGAQAVQDRKSTRLNSSHVSISYAVFCL